MIEKEKIIRIAGASIVTISLCSCQQPESKLQQPNIVYILADDLGYGDISGLNKESKIKTPAIDRLIAEGITFTDAHSGSSVCTPTRYGILTGQYCWRSRMKSGVLLGYSPSLIEAETPTVPTFLKEKGYSTACIGKWHLGIDWKLNDGTYLHGEKNVNFTQELIGFREFDKIDFTQPAKGGPLGAGFDYSYVLPASLDFDPYCYLENNKVIEAPTAYTEGNQLNTGATGAFWRAGQLSPSFIFEGVLPTFADKAVEYIKNRKNQKNPFYLYFPMNAPHTPWVPQAKFRSTSGAGEYGDYVQEVDSYVQQVLSALEENGFRNNTLVIFASDNGAYWKPDFIEKFSHRSNYSFRGMKSDAWEGGHHIPFIVRWPGQVKAGSRCDETICLTDFFDTVRELNGITDKQSRPVDSYSILPLLLKKKTSVNRPPVIHHSGSGKFAIRDKEWKFIEGLGSGGFSEPKNPQPGPGDPAGQLYNLKNDPKEKENLWFKLPEQVEIMQQKLDQIRSRK
jgi:arylsulfatase A